MLTRNTTWSLQRDAALGVDFPAVNFYDGQGFMVTKELGVSSVRELDGASICVNAGTTTELNAADFLERIRWIMKSTLTKIPMKRLSPMIRVVAMLTQRIYLVWQRSVSS